MNQSNSLSPNPWLIAMGLTLCAIIFGGIFTAEVIGRDSPLSVSLAAVGVASFLFLLRIQKTKPEDKLITESSMRSAIAGSIVIQYLALVATVAYFNKPLEEVHPLTQMVLTNFTTIVGIVIAFYFGSSAYLQKKGQRSPNRKPKPNSDT